MRNAREILSCLLLVSVFSVLTGCAQRGENKDVGVEKGSDSQEAMVIGVSESVEDFYRAAVAKFCKDNPDIQVTITVIPDIDNKVSKENEEKTNKMDQMRVEIMAGKGPDVFLLDSKNPLFPDVIKNYYGGTFYDMESILGEEIENLDLIVPIMEAGVVNGGRYLIPLGYTVTGIAAAEEWLGGWKPVNSTPAGFLSEVLQHGGMDKYLESYLLETSLSSYNYAPLLDYKEESVIIDENQKELLKFALEQEEIISDNLENDASLVQIGDPKGISGESILAQFILKGENPVFLAVPNGMEGTTAQISTFAAVRANSGHTESAGELIKMLLSDEMQGVGGWESLSSKGKQLYSIPVNRRAIAPTRKKMLLLIVGQVTDDAKMKAAERVADAVSQSVQDVTAARFTAYEDSLLFEYVIKEYNLSGTDLDKCIGNLKEELRFYFSE